MEDSRIGLSIGTALDRFIKRFQDDFPYATGELSQLLRDIALAGKVVNREVNKAGLINLSGSIGSDNIQGEDQQKLDVLANIRFIRALTKGGEAGAIISEEDEKVIDLHNRGKYIIAIDPLDGSSNIDVNVSIGTIFSIYRRLSPVGSPVTEEDVLQTGTDQVAAGYLLYGSSTILVYTTGKGVNGFTYDPTLGEFFLSHQDIRIPDDGNIYSVNEAASSGFPDPVKNYLTYCHDNEHNTRYIGSLVADFHRNLLKGGIYMYPTSTRYAKGKLRLMYECNPLAFVVEQAGGKASSGDSRILEIVPKIVHQRCPLFIGSKTMVERLESFHK